jgi:hypothetical protein
LLTRNGLKDTHAGIAETGISAKVKPLIPGVVHVASTKNPLLHIPFFTVAGYHFPRLSGSCIWYAKIRVYPLMNCPGRWNFAR